MGGRTKMIDERKTRESNMQGKTSNVQRLDADEAEMHELSTEHKPSTRDESAPLAPGACVGSICRRALGVSLGASAGEIVTTVVFYPVELVKTRLQAALVGDAKGSFAYSGLLHGLSTIVRKEGLLGLYTGFHSALVRSILADFVTVYLGEVAVGFYEKAGLKVDKIVAVLLRMLGGCGSVLLTSPLEIVTTRLSTSQARLTVADAVRGLWKEGGLPAFWSGLFVNFVLCLNPALMLTLVQTFSAKLLAFHQARQADRSRPEIQEQISQVPGGQMLLVGAVAKFLTMCLVYPLVRGKVLLQAYDARGKGLIQVLYRTFQEEGFGSLYKGLRAQMSKSILSSSLKYAVMDRTEKFFITHVKGSAA